MTTVFVTGYHVELRDLCDALTRQPELELIGWAGHVGEAVPILTTHEIDVVLHADAGAALPRDELIRIREATRAPIVLLVDSADGRLLEEALEADVADVIVLPEPAERVAYVLRRASRAAQRQAATPEEKHARVITVFSPKGGTGKTVISANLASTIAKQEQLRTLVLDFDLQFGDAAIMLGIEPEQTLHDLVTAPGELDAEKFGGYLTRHPLSGIDLLAAPLRPEDGELVTEDKVERLLDVARESYEVVIVDTSPFFHGPMLATLDRTDVLLLVSSPEIPTLKNVRLGIETLRLLSFPDDRIRICLNRADADAAMRRAEVEGALGLPVTYELPNEPAVCAAVNRGRPLALEEPSSEFSLAIRGISRSLLSLDGAQAEAVAQQAPRGDFVSSVRGLATGWRRSRPDKSIPDAAERLT
jgi:pilus assembly protein CpaE